MNDSYYTVFLDGVSSSSASIDPPRTGSGSMPAGRRKRTGGDPTARPRPHGEPGGPDVRNTRLVFAPRLRHVRGHSPAGVGHMMADFRGLLPSLPA